MTKRYKITLKLLSPVHIGTGEDFEPMNYVIDKEVINNKNASFLYNFDEQNFFAGLNAENKAKFTKLANDTSPNALFNLHKFVQAYKDIAKKTAFAKIQTFSKVANDYANNIGKVVQKEGEGKNVFNQFTIAKTYKNPNTHKAIIPGSSIKGAISTAYQEFLYKKCRDYESVKDQMLKPTNSNLFKDLLISDSEEFASTFIDEAENLNRKKLDKIGITTRLEAISTANKENAFTLSIKDNAKFSISDLADACNDHYEPIFDSIFFDDNAKDAIGDKFRALDSSLKIEKNQFLLRVGQHSGARAITVDGIRKIKIMQGKGKFKFAEKETTIWLINKMPFGWVLCTYDEI